VFKLRWEEREKAKMKLKGRQIGSEKEKTNKDGKKTFIVRQTKRKKKKDREVICASFHQKKEKRERDDCFLSFLYLATRQSLDNY
jgi:ferredoxin-thioredoxin reductase catalytic subunit